MYLSAREMAKRYRSSEKEYNKIRVDFWFGTIDKMDAVDKLVEMRYTRVLAIQNVNEWLHKLGRDDERVSRFA